MQVSSSSERPAWHRPSGSQAKAKVEAGVQVVEPWIVAAIAKRRLFTLAELNQAVAELLVPLNNRPFRKKRWLPA